MPAAVNVDSIDEVGVVHLQTVVRALFPCRVVGECRDNTHVVAEAAQVFAEDPIVRGNTGWFGRVVDSPDGYLHGDWM